LCVPYCSAAWVNKFGALEKWPASCSIHSYPLP
jgi:hypothetical protein